MIRGLIIRLYPTKQQEVLMYKHTGSMRFIYNWALAKQIENYKKYGKRLSVAESRKELTKFKKTEGGEIRYQKTKNIIKLEKKIKKLHSKFKNIRFNYIHQATSKMVKTKPKRVVMETFR
ncbi:helix-turn-helix domain-containing protein [Tepidibacter thalassicus]|uniref:Helix-turn-helix domain-containing protein n=1 Tax=Tepidibacter thalassicus DSM 15285 TaxID=1123350 RepID=A0A1M5SUF3_9FIRM|nr:helix-turn-helix domain-containing protein [Tepidibacter thalassicus]SHH41878.1 Helix-turn-helix domain-containing protein [Tepidibacter thalassicus DSM 15285]